MTYFAPTSASDRLIVALDFENAPDAYRLVDELDEMISFYKIGPRLFYEAGAEAVKEITSRSKRVFLDLKFHDIPATVSGAVRQAAALGVTFATAHAADASAAAAATEAARLSGGIVGRGSVGILAVTVLTSTSQDQLRDDGVEIPLEDLVVRRAESAVNAGCVGVVCSAHEVASIRNAVGSDPVLVTPGIRRSTDGVGDQVRVSTPAAAIASGADYLVVGRPIAEAGDPRSEAEAFIAEIEKSLG